MNLSQNITFRKFKTKKSVVVEIGNDWLKIVEISLSSKGSYITNISLIKLANIKDSVAEVISEVFKDLKLNKRSIVTYIPRHLVTVRILEFPSFDPQEISDMVSLQVSKQTPYSKEEIIFSHRIIDTMREGYTKVMLVIARRNLISERITELEKAGIQVGKVGLSSEGVYNWFSVAYAPLIELKTQVFILVDIDSNYSDFIVICKERLVFTRNILIGANHLLAESGEWQKEFIEELRHSLELYQNEEKDIKITKIFLCGAGENIKDLDTAVNRTLDIPTETTMYLNNIRIKKNINILQDDNFRCVSLSALFGMAISPNKVNLDLTLPELRIQRMMEEKRKQLTIMGILFTSIVMVISLLLLTVIYNKNVYLTKLKQKIARIENDANKVENMRMRIDVIERRLDAKGTSIDILNKILKLTPTEIYLTNITIEEKNKAVLRGRAFAMSDAIKFVTTLENSDTFENVKATYTTTKREKDIVYAEFEIVCSYQKQ